MASKGNVFITGVSSGIGYELAKKFLDEGFAVFGISRRWPGDDLRLNKNFYFTSIDLSDITHLEEKIKTFLVEQNKLQEITYVFLHAGKLETRLARMREVSLEEINQYMNLNVWSNKIIMDFLINNRIKIGTAVFSVTKAAINPRPGSHSYSISKAALTMVMKQYACEELDIFFVALSLCTVDTVQARAGVEAYSNYPEFPELQKYAKDLLENFSTHNVTPAKRAKHMYWLATEGFKRANIKSGSYIFNINKILLEEDRQPVQGTLSSLLKDSDNWT